MIYITVLEMNNGKWLCSVVVITPDFDPSIFSLRQIFRQPQFESGHDLLLFLYNKYILVFENLLRSIYRIFLVTREEERRERIWDLENGFLIFDWLSFLSS